MNTEFNFSDDRFATCAAAIVVVALLLISMFGSGKAAAQPVPSKAHAVIQKMEPIVITAKRISKSAR